MEDEESNMSDKAFPMKSGEGPCSYPENSYYQRKAINFVKAMVDEAIAEKLDIKPLSSTSNTLRIADLGCSIGPNTFIAMQNIIEAVELKYRTEGLSSQIPEFQVFFNDHTSNDFNTLFTSLPPNLNKQYFVAGVPGSFHQHLFPTASLHFLYSSFALQWLSKVPKEVIDKTSPAWNKGKIHYTSAPNEVVEAYSAQFAEDMGSFLYARAQELVSGGLMILIMPGISNGTPHSQSLVGMLYDLLGFCLVDIAKTGLVTESEVDSFNFPIYIPTPQELGELVERNGLFCIERMELVTQWTGNAATPNAQECTMHLRMGMEGPIKEHFGSEIIDELFDRFSHKVAEAFSLVETGSHKPNQILAILKRKWTD